MREIRRKERAKDADFSRELIKNCEHAILATVNDDGSPYCIPISPVLFDDALYFHCALDGQKVDNIRREPRVCLTCIGKTKLMPEQLSTAYESAVIYGTAQMIELDAEKITILQQFSQKYTPDHMEIAEHGIQSSLSRTGICKISIIHLTGKERKAQ